MSAGADSLKSVLYALAANFGIAIGKTVAAVITRSGSMQAEAIHSFADCANQVLLLWGMRQSKSPPTSDFPMGHGKAIYFWSFVVSLLLFSVGGLFSVYEGWHKLHDTEPLSRPGLALGILGFSMVLESFSLYGALREIRKEFNGRSLWRWFRESRKAELVVIVGEDIAALAGLALAFTFVLLTVATGNPMWDALGSIAVGVLLVLVAYFVSVEIKAMLLGQSAEAPVREGIHRSVAMHPGVEQVLEIITLHFGDAVMVAVKAKMKPQPSVDALCEVINDAERRLKQEFPDVRWVFFEPDVR